MTHSPDEDNRRFIQDELETAREAHETITTKYKDTGFLYEKGQSVCRYVKEPTDKRYQRQGYASRLIDYIAGYYAGRYDKIILGTGDVPGILAFYQHRGFAVSYRVADYFTTHYDHPIFEDGVLLKDKVYLERKLRQ